MEKNIKLNKLEEAIVSSILLDTKANINKKINLLEKKSKFIKSEKSKTYVTESVKKLRKNINTLDFNTLVTNTFILKETTQQILEKETPIYVIKYPDFPFIKKPKLETLEDSTETVFLTFKIPFYAEGKGVAELRREMQILGRKLSAFGHTVINKILRQGKQNGEWPLFIGSGIWETNMPEFLNKKEVNGDVELAIDTTSATMLELKPEVAKLLAVINKTIPEFFGNTVISNKDEVGKVNNNFYSDNEESEELEINKDVEKEPSLIDIQNAEKEFQLAENTKKQKK